MSLQLVKAMKQSPGVCLFCHGNPPGDDGQLQPAITDPEVDYDWGETPYICMFCAGLIADLIDRVPAQAHDKLKQEAEDAITQLEELKAEHEALTERVHRMLEGARARKEVKDQVVTP